MEIKTTQEIIEKAFLKDMTFSISITDKERIHFNEDDNSRLKKWVAVDEIILLLNGYLKINRDDYKIKNVLEQIKGTLEKH